MAYDCWNLQNPRQYIFDTTGMDRCRMVQAESCRPGSLYRQWFSKKAMYYGKWHITYRTKIVEHSAMTAISQEECMEIIKTGRVNCSAHECFADPPLGVQRVAMGIKDGVHVNDEGS